MSKSQEAAEALQTLSEIIKPGDTIYTVLRSVSRSGMSRTIDLYIIDTSDNYGNGPRPRRISYLVAKACGFTYDNNRDALKVGGAGMDMGYHIVYSLGHVLYRDGFTHEEGKSYGRGGHAGYHDKDGGYSLRQEWM